MKEYFYYFEGGGWNSEFANTKRQAITKAMKRWEHNAKLNPQIGSFKPVKGNEAEYKSLLMLFD